VLLRGACCVRAAVVVCADTCVPVCVRAQLHAAVCAPRGDARAAREQLRPAVLPGLLQPEWHGPCQHVGACACTCAQHTRACMCQPGLFVDRARARALPRRWAPCSTPPSDGRCDARRRACVARARGSRLASRGEHSAAHHCSSSSSSACTFFPPSCTKREWRVEQQRR
jgi:hypothetical protein